MNRNLAWLHFLFLAVITALPFSTRLLAAFFDYRIAFLIYYANILFAGLSLYLAWAYAERAELTDEKPPGPNAEAIRRRIVRAQGLYAAGAVAGLGQHAARRRLHHPRPDQLRRRAEVDELVVTGLSPILSGVCELFCCAARRYRLRSPTAPTR